MFSLPSCLENEGKEKEIDEVGEGEQNWMGETRERGNVCVCVCVFFSFVAIKKKGKETAT